MQSHFQPRSRSSSQSRSAPASPLRHNSASPLASASTSSSSLSQIHFNNYFGTIPEENDQQVAMQSEERPDEKNRNIHGASVASKGDDTGAVPVHLSRDRSRAYEGRRTLRRRSTPSIMSIVRPRLAIGIASSERVAHSEVFEDAMQPREQAAISPEASSDCCPKKVVSTFNFGSTSSHGCEKELKLITESNPLRSLAKSRRLLASSSFNSLSFVDCGNGDNCGVDGNNGHQEEVNEESHVRTSEDQQIKTILLKSDLHDKRAVRMHATSSSPLASPITSAPSERPRRASSAPETSVVNGCSKSNKKACIDYWSQRSAGKLNTRRSSYSLMQRKVALLSANEYDDNDNDEEEYSDENEENVIILRSWKTTVSGNVLSETDKETVYATRRSCPPLRIWVIGDVNESNDESTKAQKNSAPGPLNRKMSKSNRAGPATTHTDVHIVALSPTEISGGDDWEDLPCITTAQVIETGESTYEVIWQENLTNGLRESKGKDSESQEPTNVEQPGQSLSEKHDLDKVTKMLETWFWQDWTRSETSKEKAQESKGLKKLKSDDKIADRFLTAPSAIARSTMRTEEHQGEHNVTFLAVPPNSMQSSRRSSRNPSSMFADECEGVEASASKPIQDKLHEAQISEHDMVTSPTNSYFRAQAHFTSCLSSLSAPDFEYYTAPPGRTTEELAEGEAIGKVSPATDPTNHKRIDSLAARRLSDLTTKECTFRNHRDSLLLTRQRLVSAGGGIDTSTPTTWPRQDSLVLTRKRLMRARNAQLSQLTKSSRRGQMSSSVDDKNKDTAGASSAAAFKERSRIRFASLAASDGNDAPGLVFSKSCDGQKAAGLIGNKGGIDEDGHASASFEMPVLVN